MRRGWLRRDNPRFRQQLANLLGLQADEPFLFARRLRPRVAVLRSERRELERQLRRVEGGSFHPAFGGKLLFGPDVEESSKVLVASYEVGNAIRLGCLPQETGTALRPPNEPTLQRLHGL